MPKVAISDINESMTASDLRSVCSDGEPMVFVSYDGGTKYGLVMDDYDGDQFQIRKLAHRPSDEHPADVNGPPVWMDRHHFMVEGPVSEEAIHVGTAHPTVELAINAGMAPFVAVLAELVAMEQSDTALPAFEVRLDTKCNDREAEMPRSYRLLVRSTMAPMMHDEITQVLAVANRYELACSHSNAGIEIHRPEEVV